MHVILHLDMDAFFASVEQRTYPWLRGRPVLVANRTGRTVVATASYEARPYGITSGMPLAEAKRRCPWAIIVEAHFARYVDTAEQIFHYLERFTPFVEVASIDEAFLDVTDTHERFGGPEAMAQEIKAWVRARFGLTCSIGVAPNKLLAKLASGLRKPDGLLRLTVETGTQLLQTLPVEQLCGIGEATRRRLAALDITTCGELARADAQRLRQQFGVVGTALHQMGAGWDDRPVVPSWLSPAAQSMSHAQTLEADTWDRQLLRAVLLGLAEQVGRRLRAAAMQGRLIVLTVRYADFTTLSRRRMLETAVDDGLAIAQVAERILATLEPLPQAVRLLGVAVTGLVSGERQLHLFENAPRHRRLLQALDALNDRYGEGTVSRAALLRVAIAEGLAARAERENGTGSPLLGGVGKKRTGTIFTGIPASPLGGTRNLTG